MVVIDPLRILNLSLITFAGGARQLVVQEALERMLCLAGSYIPSFTPNTMVTSSPLAGAEMMTFFTVPFRCFLASSAFVNNPVDSTTTWAPREVQSSSAGSFILKTLMVLLLTRMQSSPKPTWASKIPNTESYFNKCASVLGSVMSFTATISTAGSFTDARQRFRPMRPNPLIPTFTGIITPSDIFW